MAALGEHVDTVEIGTERASRAPVALARLIRRERPDVVMSTLGFNLALLAIRPVVGPSVSVVVREGNTVSSFIRDVAREHPLRAACLRRAYRAGYRFADTIICQSDFMLTDLQQSFAVPAGKLVRIYNPVDLAHISRHANDAPCRSRSIGPDILAIGKLEHQKGFDTLLRAFSAIRATHPAARLTILGEGSLRCELERLADRLRITRSVEMPGWVDNPYAWMEASDLVVSSSRYEGLPNVVIEAMACGATVVATDCPGGTSELVEPSVTGYLCEPDNDEELASTILCALSAPIPPTVAQTSVETRFALPSIADEYLAAFRASVAGRRPGSEPGER